MYSAWAEPESMSNAPRSGRNIRKHVFMGTSTRTKCHPSYHGRPGRQVGKDRTAVFGSSEPPGAHLGWERHVPAAAMWDVYGHLMPRGDRRAVNRLDDTTGRNPRATTERS